MALLRTAPSEQQEHNRPQNSCASPHIPHLTSTTREAHRPRGYKGSSRPSPREVRSREALSLHDPKIWSSALKELLGHSSGNSLFDPTESTAWALSFSVLCVPEQSPMFRTSASHGKGLHLPLLLESYSWPAASSCSLGVRVSHTPGLLMMHRLHSQSHNRALQSASCCPCVAWRECLTQDWPLHPYPSLSHRNHRAAKSDGVLEERL